MIKEILKTAVSAESSYTISTRRARAAFCGQVNLGAPLLKPLRLLTVEPRQPCDEPALTNTTIREVYPILILTVCSVIIIITFHPLESSIKDRLNFFVPQIKLKHRLPAFRFKN